MSIEKIICAGIDDLRVFQEGWYGIEKSPEGMLFRASAAQARLQLGEWRGRMQLTFILSSRPEHLGHPLQVKVSSAPGDSFEFQLLTNQWTVRTGTLEWVENGAVTIEVDKPWSPDALYHNGDARSLGILLSAVRLQVMPPQTNGNSVWREIQDAEHEVFPLE